MWYPAAARRQRFPSAPCSQSSSLRSSFAWAWIATFLPEAMELLANSTLQFPTCHCKSHTFVFYHGEEIPLVITVLLQYWNYIFYTLEIHLKSFKVPHFLMWSTPIFYVKCSNMNIKKVCKISRSKCTIYTFIVFQIKNRSPAWRGIRSI